MGSFRLIVVCLATACLWAGTPLAERLAHEAAQAEKDGKIVEAYLLYARAAAAEPHNTVYWIHASALRPRATLLSEKKLDVLGVETPNAPAEPKFTGSLTREQLADIDRMTGPPHLRPFDGLRSFHLRGNPQSLYEQVARAFGYTVIFDRDFNAQLTEKFDVDEIDYKGALHALEGATNSFIIPLSEKAMLVASDTTQKRQELEPNEAVGIPIPQRTSIQEAQELMMMVQQTLEIRHAAMDPGKRLVYLRDRASKVELARALFAELSSGKPQVSIEVEFLSTATNSSLNYGMSLPTQFPLVDFGSVLKSTPSVPTGFVRFLTFGGAATFFGIGITDASLFATASRSDAKTLLRSIMTASDGQPATLHVGDKYPIPSNAYISSSGLTSTSTTYAVVSTTSYADLNTTAVSNTGSMKLVVNGTAVPFTLPAGGNNLVYLESIINELNAGVVAETISRGTTDRPYSLAVIGASLSVTSIQLIDDPSGAAISLLKETNVESSISNTYYADATAAAVSKTGILNLSVGGTITPINLTDATNNLNGLSAAINAAGAGVTASVLNSGLTTPYYMQIVAGASGTGTIQVYDDPSGANTELFASTVEVNAAGTSLGKTVSSTSASLGASTTNPTPTFTFEDLGLVMKITPFVHDLEEVTLEVEAEFKVLGSGSYNGVPVISNRKFQGKLRLRSNQWAVVAGLVSSNAAKSLSGLPGLINIPVFGALLGDNTKTKDTSEVLIVIKPTVTSMPASEFSTRTYWFGSEMKPLSLL